VSTPAERLYQHLDTETPETEESKQFRIETKEQAIWALRKIAKVERERKEAREVAQAELSRIKEWLEEEERKADKAREHLDHLLEDYHMRQLEENPKAAKTIKLPHGTLKMRAQQPLFDRDDLAIKAWAKDNKPAVLVPQDPKLDWAGLKKQLTIAGEKAIDKETGEVVPGITVEERGPKFTVDVEV